MLDPGVSLGLLVFLFIVGCGIHDYLVYRGHALVLEQKRLAEKDKSENPS